MSVVCFCSSKDLAAQSIKNQLLQLYPFIESRQRFDSYSIYQLEQLTLVTIEQDSIFADNLDQHFTADLFIFASRHKSAAFKPALLTHIPGNWVTADLGGKPGTLCIAHPSAMKIALQTMLAERQRLGLTDWECGLEVTHHGPFIPSIPALYVEIGSTEQEWQNPTAAEAIARTIVSVAQQLHTYYPAVLGFGGPHYCPAFTRLCSETQYAVSHVLPKYHLDHLSKALIQHAINRTIGKPVSAVIDWKGMTSTQRETLLKIIESLGLKTERVRNLLRQSKD